MRQLALGILIGFSLHLLMGATTQTDRELERISAELKQTNRHLDQMSRSLQRIERPFNSSYVTVRNDR
jgi:hypothetical protein